MLEAKGMFSLSILVSTLRFLRVFVLQPDFGDSISVGRFHLTFWGPSFLPFP